jgi:hydrogenase expression/formation protein HypE
MAIMSVREGLEFETMLQSDTAPLNHTVRALLDEFGSDIHLLRDPTRGGVATVLNEIARDKSLPTRVGIDLNQNELPVLEEVFGACELLGLDPLYVAIVAAEVAERFVGMLQTLAYGESAAIIGEVTTEHPGQVVLTSRIGGRRVVSMLVGEQLPRIC